MYQGVHEYKSKKEAILDIVKKHREYPPTLQTISDDNPTYIFEYNTTGLDNNLSAVGFMKKVYRQKEVTDKYLSESCDAIDKMYGDLELNTLSEAEYTKKIEKLKLEICDVDKFVKVNNCKQITNPVAFIRNNEPSPDGLLSNEIFGITQEQRAGTFGYIDLGDIFLDPSCYKIWSRIDSRVKSIVHRTATYKITASGELVEDPEGSNGIKFLKDNFDKIKFKRTDSSRRDLKIEYLKKNKDKMFITKYLVIPPYYRDVNTTGKNVGVGYINKLYANLIRTVNSLESTVDYGFDNTGAICGRIQELILTIYDWFAGNRNATIKEEGIGIAGKKGVLRRANINKTADYASRLVLSAPEMKMETVDDIMVNMERSALPLAAVIANYYPYIVFYIKKFFENEFGGVSRSMVIDKNGNVSYHKAKDPLIEFSDDRIKKELKRFLHGYSNRFIPIEVPLEDSDKVVYMKFKGRKTLDADIGNNPEPIYNRRLTWCDIFYMAAVESTKNSHILITRYPMDSYFNEFTTGVIVSSTKETEPIYIDNEFYQFYPKIREEDIGSNTGDKFIDTMMISNLYLPGIGGDYDGDTVTVRGVYTVEANEELEKHMHSKANFIDIGGNTVRFSTKDAIQSLYNLTRILPDVKLSDPTF